MNQQLFEEVWTMGKLKPLGDRLVVEPIEQEETTSGGILLPETAKEKPQEGKVLAAGPGKLDDSGKRVEMEVKVGDRVLYAKYAGTEVKLEDDKKVLILKESDILALVENED
jgi:chaperonin GroES